MPFFDEKFWTSYAAQHPSTGTHSFWNDYRTIYQQSLTEREQHKLADFDAQFIEPVDIKKKSQSNLMIEILYFFKVKLFLF